MEQVKVTREMDRETLIDVARTSLRTKVHAELADVLTEVCVQSHACLIRFGEWGVWVVYVVCTGQIHGDEHSYFLKHLPLLKEFFFFHDDPSLMLKEF